MKKPLSASSRQIIVYISDGLADKEIAAKMGKSVKTIQNRIARLRQIFNAKNRTELALKFMLLNLKEIIKPGAI